MKYIYIVLNVVLANVNKSTKIKMELTYHKGVTDNYFFQRDRKYHNFSNYLF